MNSTDLEMIAQTMGMYCDGVHHGDIEKLRKAFHPSASIVGYYQGDLLYDSLGEFLDLVKGIPVPASSGEEYDKRIVSIDVTGTVATAKMAELYLGLRFTNYMSLVKVDGTWVIVSKTFHYDPES
jgi:hypothetical protein